MRGNHDDDNIHRAFIFQCHFHFQIQIQTTIKQPNNQTTKQLNEQPNNTVEIQHKYNVDDVAIDDEAGRAFNNGTIEGEGHKTGPGTELGDGHPEWNRHGCGTHSNDDDHGDDGGRELGDKPAELIWGQVRTTLVLANDSKNEIFCLGFGIVDGDEVGDGYSPLGVFGPDGDDDGSSGGRDGDEHHHGRQAGTAGQGLTGAERR
jgi:hypothetical protein